MARGDKNYDKVVRKVNKGSKSQAKIDAVHKMVEALITGDSSAAADYLHAYLQEKTRSLILGEKEDKKEKDSGDKDSGDKDSGDKDSGDKDSGDKDSGDKDSGEKDEKVEESTSPRANLTRARGPEFAPGADRGTISGNSLRSKPKRSNDTKSRGPEFADESGKGKIEGNALKKKPKHSNDTRATKQKFADESGKGSVADCDDGRDYDMGTGPVSESAPSAGMAEKEKSAVAKKARAGKDIGKKGKNFEKVAAKAAKEYGSKEAGERVAAAAMWKNAAKKK